MALKNALHLAFSTSEATGRKGQHTRGVQHQKHHHAPRTQRHLSSDTMISAAVWNGTANLAEGGA